MVLLLRGLELPEAVVGDKARGLLLGLAMVGTEGSGDTGGGKAGDVGFLLTLDASEGLLLVDLLNREAVFVPVLYKTVVTAMALPFRV